MQIQPDAEILQMQETLAPRRQLATMITTETNRLEHAKARVVRRSIEAVLKLLRNWNFAPRGTRQ